MTVDARVCARVNRGFAKDEHVPDLLLFPPDTQFAEDPLFKEGKIILQDKASCFPAYILSPPVDDQSAVIDATAAPGNKTSHLCALMQNTGKVGISQINLHAQLMATGDPYCTALRV